MHDQLRLRWMVIENVESFVAAHAPGFDLPRTFGGHLVGTDAVADLAFTLGHLGECGVDEIAGLPLDVALRRVLTQIDGPETHSFFSYRVAETLARYGPFDDNRLLDGLTGAQIDNLRVACDSTELLPLLDGLLPRNYLAVLARCEVARQRLGILDDPAVLDDLLARTQNLITGNPHGFLDDSHDGSGRFDIYSADLYLFCEPMADLLGDGWTLGLANALDLVATIAMRDGSSFSWGRSTGVLSTVLTIELAALAVGRGLTGDPARWLGLAAHAASGLDAAWFGSDGVISAHQHRSPEDYRGPHRRLQMTFDVLGKLAEAAARLSDVAWPEASADDTSAFPHRNELRWFSDDAAVWSFRNDRTAFVLPFVAGPSSDYLPSPRSPSAFGSPVDSVLGCFVPIAHTPGSAISPQGRFAPAGTPSRLAHVDGTIEVEHQGFAAIRPIDSPPGRSPLPGARRATYRVDGARLEVTEHIELHEVPTALSILVPELSRPLRVTADGAGVRMRRIDVSGMKEWANPWRSIDAVVEIEVEPAAEMSFSWSVAPKPVVSVTLNEHHYVRTIYDPICDPLLGRVSETAWDRPRRAGDIVHVHWPEWCFGYEATADDHRAIAASLRRHRTKVAWTQHNLTPHLDQPDVYDPIYQVWADECSLAIHHSEWGRNRVTERYRFADDCRHVVIPHPHFGPAMTENAEVPRDEAARLLGLDRGRRPAIRIGVIGAPRKEKDLQLLIDAFLAADRDDLELAIWSLSFTDSVPDDPRIVAEVYGSVDRATYDLRLAACDVIALPFIGHTMLATGTASDLVASGTPALVTDWPYLVEHLGDAGIRMGQTVDTWAQGLRELDETQLRAASAATAELRDHYAPPRIGAATADALESLGLRHV